ncbi:unnamed protein product, partial [Phaeothamnion confervicola]
MPVENINNLVPAETEVTKKPPMYRSKHDPKSLLAGSTLGVHGTTQPLGAAVLSRSSHGTFGCATGSFKPEPKCFLKRGEGSSRKAVAAAAPRRELASESAASPSSPEKAENAKAYGEDGVEAGAATDGAKSSSAAVAPAAGGQNGSTATHRRGANRLQTVPRREERPVMGLRSDKNYVTANAVEAILAAPGVAGHARRSPAEPNYLLKEDYGKVPAYLSQVKEEIKREDDMIDKFVREQMGLQEDQQQEVMEEMDETQRQQLIAALKSKWDSTNARQAGHRYQLLAHVVQLDSFGKLRRKESLEKELKALEDDIIKLEARGPVLIR